MKKEIRAHAKFIDIVSSSIDPKFQTLINCLPLHI